MSHLTAFCVILEVLFVNDSALRDLLYNRTLVLAEVLPGNAGILVNPTLRAHVTHSELLCISLERL